MPRPPSADEAGALYHALNRGNARASIFHKDEDYEAFERILVDGLGRYEVRLFGYERMPYEPGWSSRRLGNASKRSALVADWCWAMGPTSVLARRWRVSRQ